MQNLIAYLFSPRFQPKKEVHAGTRDQTAAAGKANREKRSSMRV